MAQKRLRLGAPLRDRVQIGAIGRQVEDGGSDRLADAGDLVRRVVVAHHAGAGLERRRWRAWQRWMDPARFVFRDATGTATTIARRYGHRRCGARLVGAGRKQSGIVAPLGLDGPTTGPACRADVEQFLAPAPCKRRRKNPSRVAAG